jgi:Integrase zinc binding domain
MKIQNCLMPPWDQSIIWWIDGRDPRQNRFEPVQFSAVTTSPDLINLRNLSHGTLGLGLDIIEVMDPLGVVDVPEELHEILLNRAHLLGNFGAEAMYKSIFYLDHRWTSMRHDCLKTVKSCIACQRFNIGKHGFHPLTSISAQLPWDHIALDLKELARAKKGNKYLLVVVDVCTRFVFMRALKDMTTPKHRVGSPRNFL